MPDHDRLLTLLAERSARRGHFTLASGRQSSLYIDARLTTMSPEGLALIGPLGLHAVRAANWSVDAIGGLTLGLERAGIRSAGGVDIWEDAKATFEASSGGRPHVPARSRSC